MSTTTHGARRTRLEADDRREQIVTAAQRFKAALAGPVEGLAVPLG